MTADSASIDLKHHFLIAMPGLEDETFARSVVYLCEHSPRGAMGLIINKPSDISMRLLFDKVDLPLRREDLMQNPVGHGGPVQTERGFVLHDPLRGPFHDPLRTDQPEQEGAAYASTLTVPGGLEMTTSRDVLEALSSGAGPRRVLVTLGYASWGEGQLESELGENTWLTVAASAEVIFEVPMAERYDRALDLLGLKSWMLSPDAGHA
ncbi:YqgE/AlgH family protein [Limnohabitans sp. Rim8]|jgi:putative transcriptional regulator|uniref:YqgE/AlgH family protein n=1 Tax=Limnohabitans sp. Rim8 TaxID=1100718 RepID=UPI0025D6F8B5|nr:YqgE/AlgH family protein [Limnohabitans sp. Rim8]